MKRKGIYNLLLFILIFFCIASIILLRPLDDLDEIWNYNFARNIANGLVPYRNFNMLQMPLLPIIAGIILKIFSNKLIIMRILASLLCSTIIYTTYRLFSILNIKKEVAIIYIFLIGYLFKDLFCIDYNFATLLLLLIIIWQELQAYQKDGIFIKYNKKKDLLLGILAGLTFTLKQTSGLLICIALLGNKLLFVKNKEELKIFFKCLAFRLIGIFIPIGIMLSYLIYFHAFLDFINYTVSGISEFQNHISYKGLIKLNPVGILAILVPLEFGFAWYTSVIKEKDKQKYILLVYGLAIFVIAFPISDDIHFLIAATPIIILILYEIYNLCNKIYRKLKKSKKPIKLLLDFVSIFIASFITLFIVFYSVNNTYRYWNTREEFSNLNCYKYIIYSKDQEELTRKVSEYVLHSTKSVKILDATAAVYMIPINRYNKDYDLLLKGNLGKSGEERIIKEIENSKNTQYLILKDKYSKNWQTPLSIIDYVKNNKMKIGEIEIFNIYE